MSITTDPQLFASGYERNRLDRYWTHPWMVGELMRHVGREFFGPVWECAAGRGDISQAIKDHHKMVYSTDVDISEFDRSIGPCHEKSFLDEKEVPVIGGNRSCRAIVTNPPYNSPRRGLADDFIRHGLGFFDQYGSGVDFMAILLRSEFRCGKRRVDMFGDCPHYMGELVLTTRPRWDYGDPDAPETAAPRHNFSWFLWKRQWQTRGQRPVQLFSYMPKGFTQ